MAREGPYATGEEKNELPEQCVQMVRETYKDFRGWPSAPERLYENVTEASRKCI